MKNKKTNDLSFSVEYTSLRILGDKDDSSYVTTFLGTIKATDYNKDTPEEKEIGNIKIKVFHMSMMMNDSTNPRDVFDLEGSDFDIYTSIFDKGFTLKKHAEAHFDDYLQPDILLLDRIEIQSEYRGNGITEMILDDLEVQYWESCKFFVTKAFPLQFEGKNDLINVLTDKRDVEKATDKLIKFYKKIGFMEFRGIEKNYLFRPMYN